MRKLLIILAVICPFFVVAQEPIHSRSVDHESHSVSAFAGMSLSSGQISNRFLGSFLFDENLDRAVIQDQYDELFRTGNRIGGEYEMGISGVINLANSPHAVLLSTSDFAYAELSFPANALDIAMRGNRPFLGDTVDFSGVNGYGFRCQKVGIGWSYRSGRGAGFWGMVNYINGEQFAQIRIDRSWLYTSLIGDTLAASVLGNGSFSDTGNVGFASNNGNGLGLDFGFSQEFDGVQSKWKFTAQVRNLGKLYWNKKTIQAGYDSNLLWTGLEVPNVQDVNSLFEGNELSDSLSKGLENGIDRGPTAQWLPGTVQIDFMQVKDRGIEIGGGGVARWNSIYRPFAYGRLGFRFNELVALHSTFGYGGFGGLQVGLRSVVTLSYLELYAAINNLESLAVPAKNAGAGLVINLSYLF